MTVFELSQEAGERCSIQLDPTTGEHLRQLIIQSTQMTFNRYLERIGLQATNVSNYLSGRNRISIGVLSKLLAGTNFQLQCTLQVTITNGVGANPVDSTPLEDLLFSEEPDMSQEESISTVPPLTSTLPSFLLEKPQEHKKTTLDYLSEAVAEEYSIQFGTTPPPPSTTT
jgi:transcriptional regulator with XRE-family HTH domain